MVKFKRVRLSCAAFQKVVFWPLFVYIDDLSKVIKSDLFLFTDYTENFSQSASKEDAFQKQMDTNILESFSYKWLFALYLENAMPWL